MRLTKDQQNIIVDTFLKYLKTGEIYLFGSRVYDDKKGGDIDLYISTSDMSDIYNKKINFLTKLDEVMGEQKIDLIVSKDKNRQIEQEAIKKGINLMDIQMIKRDKYINECNKHKIRVVESYNAVQSIFPISAKKYQNLSDDEVKNIDQYLFRFSKMQDTIGEKLFRIVVDDFVEDSSAMSFVDILNRLERVGILSLANDWIILRKARNNIAHQYDDEPEEMADAINKIFAQKDILIGVFDKIENYFNKYLLTIKHH